MSGFVDTQACSLTVKSILNRNVEQVGHSLSFSRHIVLRAISRQEILVSRCYRLSSSFTTPTLCHIRVAELHLSSGKHKVYTVRSTVEQVTLHTECTEIV
jgi:hypothetical protein